MGSRPFPAYDVGRKCPKGHLRQPHIKTRKTTTKTLSQEICPYPQSSFNSIKQDLTLPGSSAIYQFRLRLQDIWSQTSRNSTEMVEALEQWYHDARESGIAALQDFADQLTRYRHATA